MQTQAPLLSHPFLPFKSSLSQRQTLIPSHSIPRPRPRLRLGRRRISSPRCSLSEASMGPTATPLLQQNLSLDPDCMSHARAYWVSRSLIAWNTSVNYSSICLLASMKAEISCTAEDIEGYDMRIQLELGSPSPPIDVIQKFPMLANYKTFQFQQPVDIASLLKCQLAVACFDADGKCLDATTLQLSGVLDDMFAYSGPLGAVFTQEAITLFLWAPTAQEVSICLYNDPLSGDIREKVKLEELSGVWSIVGPTSWEGCYYVYEISVYHPSTLKIETCIVPDPYSRGLSSNGQRTWLVNLHNENLKPPGWDSLVDEKPNLLSFSDISIYELHIRDFSANDDMINPDYRGGYLAFTSQDSAGICHLKKLSDAGLTHVHLLPTFHFAGVDDDKSNWKNVDEEELAKFPPDSDKQQEAITAIQDEDGYNWGYNPVLWGVPKGSYATDPNGPSRILEFRMMVQALNRIGLRVVLDVVYNHLGASGPFDKNSVLDKVVPGYFLRRNVDGGIENSTCMNNTASEHFMVERLILDDLLCWAMDYKVDGFRFDLMGHIMKSTMVKAKTALQSLTRDKAGVDGSKIYLYGEGWDFGEVANNKRGINASQFNISGNGIGSFNDRIRDAVLGGSPFSYPLQQGFVTGLHLEPNGYDQGDTSVTNSMLSSSADHIQVGLAANLKDYILTCHDGSVRKGSEILTHDGVPVGYASSPIETINYVSAHDNETLFDIISIKTPGELSIEDRCRINHLASSIVALSQGIPFFHCGDEILRSKSLDRDSYNSGDWFNRIDFNYESNNWGVGLPPKEKNLSNWPLIKPLLQNPSFKPQKQHIMSATDNYVRLLKIRYSSPLFRLKSTNEIQERVQFHNTGPFWIKGVIVMSIEDGQEGKPGMVQLDPLYSLVVVLFNAGPAEVSVEIPALKNRNLQLHPVQLNSSDELVKLSSYDSISGCFIIPQRTTSVFVEAHGNAVAC